MTPEERDSSGQTDLPSDTRNDAGDPNRNQERGSASIPTSGTVPSAFRQLAAPIPPMLEAAIGYTGDARFVAFYWGSGDEVYYDDGRISGTGEWSPYLCFVQHRAVWPALVGYDFGSSDTPAQHYLVLDRQDHDRILYAAPEREARIFLGRQWPQPTAEERTAFAQLDLDAVNANLQTLFDELLIQEADLSTPEREAEVLAMMAAHQQHTAELLHWLDAQPDDGRARALMDEMRWQLDEAVRTGKPRDTDLPF